MPKVICSNCNYVLADVRTGVKGKAELKCPKCNKLGKYADISTIREHKVKDDKDDIEITVKIRHTSKNNDLPF
jgi:phage FluMu protein Com